jgi:hypothetical protein
LSLWQAMIFGAQWSVTPVSLSAIFTDGICVPPPGGFLDPIRHVA